MNENIRTVYQILQDVAIVLFAVNSCKSLYLKKKKNNLNFHLKNEKKKSN